MVKAKNSKFSGVELQDVEVEPTGTTKKKETKRLVIELPTKELENFKCISAIYGKTQTEMVIRALREFIECRNDIVKPYLEIRKQAEKDYALMKKNDRKKTLEKSIKEV